MKPFAIAALVLVLVGCDSGPQIVVQASLDGRPVADLPIILLPYDRERLQDSLRREAGDDAPSLPQELLLQLARAESALSRVPQDSAGIRRADSLRVVRERTTARLDSSRSRIREWEARLLRRADSLGRVQAEEEERRPAADTTDASGRAALSAGPGQSWIRARYVLPDAVIEWNVPVTLPAGQDSILVPLDRRNGRATPL